MDRKYLQTYEPTLIKYYPKEILKKYEIEVQNMSLVSGDRKKYRKIVHNLRKMKKYPEGKELVDRIIEDWKIKYNRRPAMMDELDNI